MPERYAGAGSIGEESLAAYRKFLEEHGENAAYRWDALMADTAILILLAAAGEKKATDLTNVYGEGERELQIELRAHTHDRAIEIGRELGDITAGMGLNTVLHTYQDDPGGGAKDIVQMQFSTQHDLNTLVEVSRMNQDRHGNRETAYHEQKGRYFGYEEGDIQALLNDAAGPFYDVAKKHSDTSSAILATMDLVIPSFIASDGSTLETNILKARSRLQTLYDIRTRYNASFITPIVAYGASAPDEVGRDDVETVFSQERYL